MYEKISFPQKRHVPGFDEVPLIIQKIQRSN